MMYAIRMPDGRLITDPEWHTPADVMRAAHGHGVDRMPGELVRVPRRIQRRRTAGWRMPEGAVYVGRPTGWGNPFEVGVDLQLTVCPVKPGADWPYLCTSITPAVAVAAYRLWVVARGLEPVIREQLAGRDLACWCRLDQPCHGDVLLEVANS